MKAPQAFAIIMVVLVGAVTISVLHDRSQMGDILHTRRQFDHLRAGDKVVLLCRQCDSRREIAITSQADANERFKEGATFTCPGCKDIMRVVSDKASASDQDDPEIRFVNEKGKECLRIARATPPPK
jgi:RNase P subunit RPR2